MLPTNIYDCRQVPALHHDPRHPLHPGHRRGAQHPLPQPSHTSHVALGKCYLERGSVNLVRNFTVFQVRKLFIEKMPRVLFMQRPHYHPKYTPSPYTGPAGVGTGTGTGTSSRASSSSSPSSGSAMAEKGLTDDFVTCISAKIQYNLVVVYCQQLLIDRRWRLCM